MKAYGEKGVQIQSLLILALDGDEIKTVIISLQY
jgi:hypothetical protein